MASSWFLIIIKQEYGMITSGSTYVDGDNMINFVIFQILKVLNMIESSYLDSDVSTLQFDKNCSESEKKFFNDQCLNVSNIIKKVYCTTCNVHIETATISQKHVLTHSMLKVTQCIQCYSFYVRILK